MADRPTLEPRCISAGEAAAYCGLTLGGFRRWITIGRLPPALPGTRRWDRRAIDCALDQISGLPSISETALVESGYDAWKRGRDARRAVAQDPDLRGPAWRRVPK